MFRLGISCNPHATVASGSDIHHSYSNGHKGSRTSAVLIIQIPLTFIMNFFGELELERVVIQ